MFLYLLYIFFYSYNKMPHGIYKKLTCNSDKHSDFIPQKHQSEVLDYFLNKSKYKGLLLYHKLGSGKSCSSILISDEMLSASKVKKVYVMTPGSLRQNFIEEYCERCGRNPMLLRSRYTFITTNYSVGNRIPDLNGSLVIIDEVHNLINGVKNQSVHSSLIYKALMKYDCRILALTGTPIYNDISEWPFLGNLLKPGTFPDPLKYGKLNNTEFESQFTIDDDGNIIPKNGRMLATQLRGIISYFPGSGEEFYPEVIYENPIRVRMTIKQDRQYWDIFDRESLLRAIGPPPKSLLRTNPKRYKEWMEEYIMAVKYVLSRSASNFCYPSQFRSSTEFESKDEIKHIGLTSHFIYVPTGQTSKNREKLMDEIVFSIIEEIEQSSLKDVTVEEKKKISEDVSKNIKKDIVMGNIGWIEKSEFQNKELTDIYSRKIVAVITNVINNWNSKHVLFTYYKTKSGVKIIHTLLKMCGVETEIYSGDISDNDRKTILNNFNAENNRYGEKIKILLVTEAGAEGINILEAQHMHILESSTREMKIQQAIGRVVRYKSHSVEGRKPMPKNERVVHIWRYWSTSNDRPITIIKEIKKEDGSSEKKESVITDKTCVDELLYYKGRNSVNSTRSFLSIIKNSSITSYDKSKDTDRMLKDYRSLPINVKMERACKISDDRYEKTQSAKDQDESKDDNYENIFKDFSSVGDDSEDVENED
jgi:superfamily II DNA or RNA helicase